MTRAADWKLLIVDDHALMRQTLRALLSPLAGDIREAADGAEAVKRFVEQQPDWVIMDIQMKPVGGLAATRAIRRRFPTARIVMVTQHDDADLHAEAIQAGACACFLKENLAAVTRFLSLSVEGENPPASPSNSFPITTT